MHLKCYSKVITSTTSHGQAVAAGMQRAAGAWGMAEGRGRCAATALCASVPLSGPSPRVLKLSKGPALAGLTMQARERGVPKGYGGTAERKDGYGPAGRAGAEAWWRDSARCGLKETVPRDLFPSPLLTVSGLPHTQPHCLPLSAPASAARSLVERMSSITASCQTRPSQETRSPQETRPSLASHSTTAMLRQHQVRDTSVPGIAGRA